MSETRVDQITLLKTLLTNTNHANQLSIMYAAWASVYTTGSEYLKKLVLQVIDEPSPPHKRDIEFAVARMGVTNPYFIARQFVSVKAGGSLDDLNFRSFSMLNIENEQAYHHACVAISLINGGHMCLSSHVGSLQASNETDENIDCSMRIAAASHSLNILGRGDE